MAYKLTTMLSQLNALTVLQDTTANLTAATTGFSSSPPHDGANAAGAVVRPVSATGRYRCKDGAPDTVRIPGAPLAAAFHLASSPRARPIRLAVR